MYRRLSNSFVPHAKGRDIALFVQANHMRDKVAKISDETYLMIKKYDRLMKE